MTIGIIGFGKFGKFISEIISQNNSYAIKIFSQSHAVDNKKFFDIEDISSCDVVIPCVPIHAFERTIKDISGRLKSNSLVIDVCSVKVHPKEVMLENLSEEIQIIATHPMFGPESYKKMGGTLEGLIIVVDAVRCKEDYFSEFIKFLQNFNVKIIEMSCEEHDRLAAVFHFTTMFAGIMVKETGIQRTAIDTLSAERMHDFMDMVGDDIVILKDMYEFNPFCREQMRKLTRSFDSLKESIVI